MSGVNNYSFLSLTMTNLGQNEYGLKRGDTQCYKRKGWQILNNLNLIKDQGWLILNSIYLSGERCAPSSDMVLHKFQL